MADTDSDDDLFPDLSGEVGEGDENGGNGGEGDNCAQIPNTKQNDHSVIEIDAAFSHMFRERPPPQTDDNGDDVVGFDFLASNGFARESTKSQSVALELSDEIDSQNRDLGVLVDWLRSAGGFVHPALRLGAFKDAGIGGYLHVIIKNESPTGKDVPVDKNFEPGELIIRVPATCVLYADDASIEPLLWEQNKAEAESGGYGHISTFQPEQLKQVMLALALHDEFQKGPSRSEMWPYLATLPSSLASFPVLWGGASAASGAEESGDSSIGQGRANRCLKELELLVGASPSAKQQLRLQTASLKAEYDLVRRAYEMASMAAAAEAQAGGVSPSQLPPPPAPAAAVGATPLVGGGGSAAGGESALGGADVGTFLKREWEPLQCTFEEYVRAKLLVCSRCFGIGARGDVALLPGVDMLNHSASPHVALGRSNPPPPHSQHPVVESPSQGGEGKASATAGEGTSPRHALADHSSGRGNGGTAVSSSSGGGVLSGSSSDGFTLTLVRRAVSGEQLYSTYDTRNDRPAVSWLLNYGFVPESLSGGEFVQGSGADGESFVPRSPGSGSPPAPTGTGEQSAVLKRYADAITGLEALGAHTHGAVRLLKIEQAAAWVRSEEESR